MFSDALEQEGQEIVNFKCISNTDDFEDNNASKFYNRPYEGVEFDRRFSYNVRALSSTIPFSVDSHLEKDLWYKRLQIPYWESYQRGAHDRSLSPAKYKAVIDACERISLPMENVKDEIIGSNAKLQMPDKFFEFFNSSYLNKVIAPPYKIM